MNVYVKSVSESQVNAHIEREVANLHRCCTVADKTDPVTEANMLTCKKKLEPRAVESLYSQASKDGVNLCPLCVSRPAGLLANCPLSARNRRALDRCHGGQISDVVMFAFLYEDRPDEDKAH